jgi:hypothetical protein
MSSSALENLLKLSKGGLKQEPPSQAEIDGLIRSATRKRQDAALSGLGEESRFDLLYNAAHALALAALRRHGYRSDNRVLVFQALAHTVSFPAAKWRILDRCHGKRNRAQYEGHFDVDKQLIEELATVTAELEAAATAISQVHESS